MGIPFVEYGIGSNSLVDGVYIHDACATTRAHSHRAHAPKVHLLLVNQCGNANVYLMQKMVQSD